MKVTVKQDEEQGNLYVIALTCKEASDLFGRLCVAACDGHEWGDQFRLTLLMKPMAQTEAELPELKEREPLLWALLKAVNATPFSKHDLHEAASALSKLMEEQGIPGAAMMAEQLEQSALEVRDRVNDRA